MLDGVLQVKLEILELNELWDVFPITIPTNASGKPKTPSNATKDKKFSDYRAERPFAVVHVRHYVKLEHRQDEA